MVVLNKYKNILDDLIDNSDQESLDWLKLINKGSYNIHRSKSNLTSFLKEDCFDKNISILDNSL